MPSPRRTTLASVPSVEAGNQPQSAEWRQSLGRQPDGCWLRHQCVRAEVAVGTGAERRNIINTVSAAAVRHVPSESLYNTSKYALLGLTESLQRELARYGIGVSALLPGGVQTNIGESMRRTSGHIRSDDQHDALLAELRTVDTAHIGDHYLQKVRSLVLEVVREQRPAVLSQRTLAQRTPSESVTPRSSTPTRPSEYGTRSCRDRNGPQPAGQDTSTANHEPGTLSPAPRKALPL